MNTENLEQFDEIIENERAMNIETFSTHYLNDARN